MVIVRGANRKGKKLGKHGAEGDLCFSACCISNRIVSQCYVQLFPHAGALQCGIRRHARWRWESRTIWYHLSSKQVVHVLSWTVFLVCFYPVRNNYLDFQIEQERLVSLILPDTLCLPSRVHPWHLVLRL